MALLGAQMVITLVMVSIIQKLGSHYSFARWLLCSTGLVRYLYPTNEELKKLIGKENTKSKTHSKKGDTNGKVETFNIPRSLDITLEEAKVSPFDVIHLKYYMEYQWLVDFAFYSTILYTVTEVYLSFFPLKDEINLSMLWCLLVLGFSFKVLFMLTLQYFKGEEAIGERSVCLVMGGIYLLIAMMVLIIDEKNLEVGLDQAYISFNESASAYLNNQGLSSSGPASKLILKLWFAAWCGFVGCLFTFPGIRMARMHWDSLTYHHNNKFLQLLLNISFILPLFLVILWIKPIARDYLTVRVFSGMQGPLMEGTQFDSLRLILVILTVLLRIVLMPVYLQAYLNMPKLNIEEIKKESGNIPNTEYQKRIARVFYYLCAVSIQYIAPLLLCLYFTFMYKTLGGFTWQALFYDIPPEECDVEPPSAYFAPTEETDMTIVQSAQTIQLAMENVKNIFTTDVFRGIFGFTTWWTCFSLFSTSSVGMLYQTYFRKP